MELNKARAEGRVENYRTMFLYCLENKIKSKLHIVNYKETMTQKVRKRLRSDPSVGSQRKRDKLI